MNGELIADRSPCAVLSYDYTVLAGTQGAALQENAKALNAAKLFEIDDVIDPAETRGPVAATLDAARRPERPRSERFVDSW